MTATQVATLLGVSVQRVRELGEGSELELGEGPELIIDTDLLQQQRWSTRRHERSVLRKTFRTVDSKL